MTFGLLNLSASYGSTINFNVGIQVRNGTSNLISQQVSGEKIIGEYPTHIGPLYDYYLANPYTVNPQFALPATISSFSTNQSGAVSGVSIGMSWSGYNTTISGQVDIAPPNASLNVYSDVSPFTLKIKSNSFGGAYQQYIESSPYPDSIGIINKSSYTISGIYNGQTISYSFTAKSTNNFWFNFSIPSGLTSSSSTSTYVSNISIGYPKSLHYNINYLKNGDYQGGTWYIVVNQTQYAIQENIIGIKEYYNTSPYSLSIIFGNYTYEGFSYSPTINSYNIPSTSNNTIYVVYYNMTNTQSLTVFGMDEFDVLAILLIFTGLMLPAVAISYMKKKGGS